MSKEKQIKLFSFAIAVMIAVVSTIMILGIQVGFNQNEVGAKITAPILVIGLLASLFVYKLIKKQSKTNFIIKHAELKSNGKKPLSPYFTIGFTYFDYALYCGILSLLCGIVSGVLNGVYNTLRFETLTNWAYTLSRMAIVFAVYVLCLIIYMVGNMIAYSQREKVKQVETKEVEE